MTEALEKEIVEVSRFIQQTIVNPPGGANVGEWCKKEKCWKEIREYKYEISTELADELISVEKAKKEQSIDSSIELTENDQAIIDEAASIPAATWFELSRWAKETQNFAPWQRSIVFSVGTLIGREKKPSIKQSIQALKVYNGALEKGFDPGK